MGLRERLDQLDERERRLLNVLVAVIATFVLLFLPLGMTALLSTEKSENEALRALIQELLDSQDAVARQDAENEAILSRYRTPAPALAGFLARLGRQHSVEIPETQDLATVPHGKKYEERSTKIILRKVGLFSLSKFMEGIAKARYPIAVSRINIRKRGSEPDSYDVEMVVSAFDRKAKEAKSEDEDEDQADEDTP